MNLPQQGLNCLLFNILGWEDWWHYSDIPVHIIYMYTSGIILGMDSANERRCYYVTSSLIGWAFT